MLVAPPELAPGQREVAILVDAETGVAGKIGPDSVVDIVGTFEGDSAARHPAAVDRRRRRPRASSRSARRSSKGGRGVQQAESDPERGRAGHVRADPEGAAPGHRGGVVRPGGPAGAAAPGRHDAAEEGRADLHATRAAMTQHRLLLAIADAELAQSASALARRARSCRSSTASPTPRRRPARCAGSRSTSSSCTTRSARVPVLEVARDISASFPEVGLVLIAADDSPDLLRAAMHAGLRDVVSLPLSLEQLEGSVRAASQWSRTMRDRVAGRGVGRRGARRPADRRGRRQGRRRHDHRLRSSSRSPRCARRPGGPVCVVDFDLQKGDFRSFLDMPLPALGGRPRRGRRRDLRAPPAGDALHAQGGLPGPARARRRRARRGGQRAGRARRSSARSRRATR